MGNSESSEPVEQDIAGKNQRDCRIIVIGSKSGDHSLTELRWLPKEAHILGTALSLDELEKDGVHLADANVILNATGNAAILAPICKKMPNLCWMHSITAGVDHLLFPELVENDKLIITNAKGIFSSSLAEYVLGACAYFAKDFPRLIRQRENKHWNRFCVEEIRGKCMGIVGYGDIGRACASLAKAYGMRTVCYRRLPHLSSDDPLVDEIYGPDNLNHVISVADYLVLAAPLTSSTVGLINDDTLARSKDGQVVINIGRGPLIDEEALVRALNSGKLRGAALDVFHEEPLPQSSPLWDLQNVLLSPHNADMTSDFRHRSVKFFTENCRKFIEGEDLDSIVDKVAGY